jgi:hypothetical protein
VLSHRSHTIHYYQIHRNIRHGGHIANLRRPLVVLGLITQFCPPAVPTAHQSSQHLWEVAFNSTIPIFLKLAIEKVDSKERCSGHEQ